jgi:hypothetical protein
MIVSYIDVVTFYYLSIYLRFVHSSVYMIYSDKNTKPSELLYELWSLLSAIIVEFFWGAF